MRLLRDDRGQVFVIGMIFILGVLLFTFAYHGLAEAYVVRAGAQAAADAAALAGAQQAGVTEQVDARGIVYSSSVTINPTAAANAARAMWNTDASLYFNGTTTTFDVTVDNGPPAGYGPTVNVVGSVAVNIPTLGMDGVKQPMPITVQATAGTCGSTTWPGTTAVCAQ